MAHYIILRIQLERRVELIELHPRTQGPGVARISREQSRSAGFFDDHEVGGVP